MGNINTGMIPVAVAILLSNIPSHPLILAVGSGLACSEDLRGRGEGEHMQWSRLVDAIVPEGPD